LTGATPATSFYPVIPAGGSGKRLWPLSRRREPKFLMPVGQGGGPNLLGQTLERLRGVAPVDHAYVVTGEAYARRIVEEAPGIDADRVLVEPAPMDSGPAIALAAAVIAQRHPGSVMGSFAADHFIPDEALFAEALRDAIRGAERGLLMTIGVEPTRPETGYGYIHYDTGSEADGVYAVSRFKEKPSLAVATEFLEAGGYLWNASMFVWRPEVFLEELRGNDPAMHEGVTAIAGAWDTPEREAVLVAAWPRLTKVAVEYVVMEPASLRGRVGTVRGRFRWTDVGDFNTLGEINAPDADGNAVLGTERSADARVWIDDGRNLVVHPASGKLLAVIGAEDLAIIDTDDVLLVCARDRVQDVKALVDSLAGRAREDLL
jgi:mannose-1-phosphate guanylyltransferase